MNSATKYNKIDNRFTVHDPKSKCGEILISIRTFSFEFACTLCPEEYKCVTFIDFLHHVTQDHSLGSADEGEDIRMSEYYDNTDMISEDPLAEKAFGEYEEIEIKEEEEYEYEITTENLSDSKDLSVSFIGDNDARMESTEDAVSNVHDNTKHCKISECKEKDPTRRQHILKVIDMFRKCLGLWHMKTASNVSVKEKKAVCTLLTKHCGIPLPVYKMRLMLGRITTCFNASWKTDKTQKPRPWYYNSIEFLKFADDDEIPNDFDDFRCPFCTRDEVNASGTIDLWNHIIGCHTKSTQSLESKSYEKALLWPTEHILQFIDIYREQECLWDSNSSDYYDRPVRTKAYQTIVGKFNEVRPNALKNQNNVLHVIRQLKIFFRRVQSKLNLMANSATAENTGNQRVYEQLQFFKDNTNPRDLIMSLIDDFESSDEDDNTKIENKEDGSFSQHENTNHCCFRECKEQDPTRRLHFAKLIGIYHKCIGLWHKKTASSTSKTEKTAVYRLLAQNYGMPIPVFKMGPILDRMTLCFNKAWKSIKTRKPKPWYYRKLEFLKFADADQVPNDMFDDFRCPFCSSDEMHASDAMDLWNHIVEYHKRLDNSLESKSNVNPLSWPTKHILEFISIYRKQESVWNKNSPDYFNRSLKTKGYQTIIEQFSKVRPEGLTNRNTVLNAISLLRSHFRRVHTKLQVSNVLEKAETTEEIENNKVYDELLFLKDVVLTKTSLPIETYNCDLCKKNFQKKFLFYEHFKLRHKDAEFKCNICPVALSSEVNLKNHQDTHEQGDGESYDCPCCHLVYTNSSDLQGHLYDHLPNRLDEQICPVCEQKLIDRSSLSTHLQRHTNIKRYFCDSCPKGFVTSTDLNLHVKIHSDKRAYVCEVCGMCYKHRHHLTIHHRIHEEPRFKCKDCDMKFRLRTNLREHEKSHAYSDVPEGKVVCEVCHRFYGHARALRSHQRIVHKISKTNCIRKKNIKINTK